MKIKNAVVTDKAVAFWNSIFSNFFPCKFEFKGMKFDSSEQAFMWCKARHFGDVQSCIQILEAESPREAKQLGRGVKNFDGASWDKAKYGYMVEVLVAKFKQNPQLKKVLLETQDRTLIEGSPVDQIWGVGIHWQDINCLNESKWKGENLLGKALMDVRTIILKESV